MDSDKQHTFLNVLPSLIFGLGLVVFLAISFVLYHRQMTARRKRELETMDLYLYVHPDITLEQYYTKQIPVRNRIKLMTNTHLDKPDELRLILVTEHKLSTSTLKAKKSSNLRGDVQPYVAACTQHNDDDVNDGKNKMERYIRNTEKFKMKDTKVEDNVNSEQENEDSLNTFKNGKHKRRNKKRRKKLQQLLLSSVSKGGAFQPKIELLNHTKPKPKRDSTYIARDDFNATYKNNLSNLDQVSDVFANQVTNGEADVDDLTNSYYDDIGVSFEQIKRQKSMRIRKAETLQEPENLLMIKKPDNAQNAFYDQLTMKEESKKQYKELIHRDSRGNLTLLSRSLPHLENDI